MARPVLSTSNAADFTSATTGTVNLTIGVTGTYTVYGFVTHRDAGTPSVVTMTADGNAMTQLGTSQAFSVSSGKVFRWRGTLTAGTRAVVATLDQARNGRIIAFATQTDGTTPNGTVAQGEALTSGAITLTADQSLLSFFATEDSGGSVPPQYTATGTATQTKYHDGGLNFQRGVAFWQDVTGSCTASVTYGGSNDGTAFFAVPLNGAAAPSGPSAGATRSQRINQLLMPE